jgi:methylated-DNA-protein-cysteine methyltransferase-like protein
MQTKSKFLTLLRRVPSGRVTTPDILAGEIGIPPPVVHAMLTRLTEDERDMEPWHRVVASGGAIGRGPHRDQQFARLVREGLPVSPAGIVQDLARVLTTTFEARTSENPKPSEALQTDAPKPVGRSRGMKSRP